MKRSALTRLAAVIALAAAGLVIATTGAASEVSASHSPLAEAQRIQPPSATADATNPDAIAVAITRDVGDSRFSPLRSFAATLAALIALVALVAARGVRSDSGASRAARTRFDARRRGPPVLHAC